MPRYFVIGRRPLNLRTGKYSFLGIRCSEAGENRPGPGTAVRITTKSGNLIWEGEVRGRSRARARVVLAEVTITKGGVNKPDPEDKVVKPAVDDPITVTVGGNSNGEQPLPPPYNDGEDGEETPD